MTNMVCIVGRLYEEPKMINEDCFMTVEVTRPYKNENEEYEKDLLDVMMKGNIASQLMQYCHKGDAVGVKGYIKKLKNMIIVAEKITFLGSNMEEK